MKKHLRSSSSHRSGFTLVEILVVIAIIAILAGVLLAGLSNAIAAAKRLKAGNTATQIQTAVLNYQTEYGAYPVPAGSAATDYLYAYNDKVNWPILMIALCGNTNPLTGVAATSTVPNIRQIPYLSPKRADLDTTYGVLINPMTAPTTNPPTTFNLVLDSDYDGVAGDSGTAMGTMPDFVNWTQGTAIKYLATGVTQGVALWCDCDPKSLTTPATSTAPNFWVHTY